MRFRDFNIVETAIGSKDKYFPAVNQILSQKNVIQLEPTGGTNKGKIINFYFEPGQQIQSSRDMIKGRFENEEELVSVPAGWIHKSTEIKKLTGVSTSSKEKLLLKPSHIFPDGSFPASKVFDAVINNSVLESTDYGKMVINIAKEIQSGQTPDMSQIPKEFKTAIRDYAGEYLGVLAMLKGVANFPNRDAWLKHLGINNLGSIELFFPKESNNPLADSIGYFKNTNTGNMILVSSKGGSGAAPSFNGLKIPDNLRTPEYKNEIEFIETMQTKGTAFTQPFYGINVINDISPDSISDSVRKILPIDDSDIEKIMSWATNKSLNKTKINSLPKEYKDVIESTVALDRVKDTATLGGLIQYAIKLALMEAINQNNALPNFEPLAREILQYNFVQIHTNIVKNQMVFDVLWPNKNMATGKITIANKYSATEPTKGKMSFKVSPN